MLIVGAAALGYADTLDRELATGLHWWLRDRWQHGPSAPALDNAASLILPTFLPRSTPELLLSCCLLGGLVQAFFRASGIWLGMLCAALFAAAGTFAEMELGSGAVGGGALGVLAGLMTGTAMQPAARTGTPWMWRIAAPLTLVFGLWVFAGPPEGPVSSGLASARHMLTGGAAAGVLAGILLRRRRRPVRGETSLRHVISVACAATVLAAGWLHHGVVTEPVGDWASDAWGEVRAEVGDVIGDPHFDYDNFEDTRAWWSNEVAALREAGQTMNDLRIDAARTRTQEALAAIAPGPVRWQLQVLAVTGNSVALQPWYSTEDHLLLFAMGDLVILQDAEDRRRLPENLMDIPPIALRIGDDIDRETASRLAIGSTVEISAHLERAEPASRQALFGMLLRLREVTVAD